MLRQSFFAALCLAHTWFHPRFNLQTLFLKAQITALKACLQRHGIKYAVLEPEEKEELLRLGELLGHDVKDIFLVNSISTYRKWRSTKENGGKLKRPGRLRTITQETVDHILRFARQNTDWGYSRIVGELKKISIKVSHSTVKAVLKRNGIMPPPKGTTRRPWKAEGRDRREPERREAGGVAQEKSQV
ncbi:MAG: helix-turn-helix domain-containing protein [Planctomycetota bacterium]